jgi:hypothetical protein
MGQTAGTLALWSVVVHENGVRTLGETIFYFDHATRELPVDVLTGLMIGAAAAFGLEPKGSGRTAAMFAGLAVLVVAVILGGALATVGLDRTLVNLSQSPTRPGVALLAGSHWYYHLLSTGFAMLAALAAGLWLSGSDGLFRYRGPVAAACVAAIWAAVSWGFLSSPDLVRRSFGDPIYLGHQAREILVAVLVVIPLSFGLCLVLAERPVARNSLPGPIALAAVFALAAAGLAAFVGVTALSTGSQAMGQSDDLRVILLPHFYEHVLTYALTGTVAVAMFVWIGSLGRPA